MPSASASSHAIARQLLAGALALVAAGCVTRAAYREPPRGAPAAASPARTPAERAGPSAPTGALGLTEAVRLAHANNPDLEVAGARVEAAAAMLAASEAALWPRLVLDLGWTRSDAPSAFLFKSIDAHELAPGTDFNDPGWFTNTEAGATLRYNLFDGGIQRLTLYGAATALEEGAARWAALENALTAAVVAAWLEARTARELAAADDASVRSVEAEVRELAARVEGGAALRADLLSLEVRLAEARERRLRTGLAERLVLATLRSLLALEPEAPLELAPDEAGKELAGELPSSLSEAQALALVTRPELEAARLGLERARLALAAAGRTRWPRLDLLARVWGGENDTTLDLNEANHTLALSLGFDLVDGGARAAELELARARLHEVRAQDRRALLEVALDVEVAWLQLEEARARLAVAQQSVGAGEESLALVERQFRDGATTVTRFLEAEAARTRAQTSSIRAALDLERARIGLARATGRLGANARGMETLP